jgi:DNA-binding transcriptional ArsR family regulator
LSPQAISRQLGILRRAGLITVRRGYADRRWLIYFIEPRNLGQITAWLAGTEVGRVFPTERARKSWLDAILPLERKDPEDTPDRETGNSPN